MTHTPAQLGMPLDIVCEYNATNGGISSRHHRLTVVGVLDDRGRPLTDHTPAAARVIDLPGDLHVSPVTDDAPAVWLRVRMVRNMGVVYSLEPATAAGEPRPWFMYGGNQAASADPRWLDFATPAPINVHDRVE